MRGRATSYVYVHVQCKIPFHDPVPTQKRISVEITVNVANCIPGMRVARADQKISTTTLPLASNASSQLSSPPLFSLLFLFHTFSLSPYRIYASILIFTSSSSVHNSSIFPLLQILFVHFHPLFMKLFHKC